MHRRKFDVALKSLAELFKILAHPDRIRLIGLLHQSSELDVSQLTKAMQVSQSTVSQHLKLLKLNKVVSERRSGKHILYKLKSEHIGDLIVMAIETELNDFSWDKSQLNLLKEVKDLF